MTRSQRGSARASTVVIARHLRRNATHAEGLLWEQLRENKVLGLKFRRQHPFGKFVLDFFYPQLRLAIELDGRIHDHTAQKDYDAVREEHLANDGIRVLRFRNEEVETDLASVLKAIESAAVVD